MTSLYTIAIPPVIGGLKNAAAILTKAINQAEAENIDKQTYLSARLHPTMADLPKQIYYITNATKVIPSLLNPSIAKLELSNDPDTTFPEMLARLKKTYEYLESINKEDIDGRENEEVKINIIAPGGATRELKFTPIAYCLEFVQPNFWFHVAITYGILRKENVSLMKRDYLSGSMFTKIE